LRRACECTLPRRYSNTYFDGGEFGKFGSGITKEQANKFWVLYKPMPADKFAREALDNVAKNPALFIVPGNWARAYLTFRLLPSLWYR
jgi:hypothetical protein